MNKQTTHTHRRALSRICSVLLITIGLMLLIFPALTVSALRPLNAPTAADPPDWADYRHISDVSVADSDITPIIAASLTPLFGAADLSALLPGDAMRSAININNNTGTAYYLSAYVDGLGTSTKADLAEVLWLKVERGTTVLYNDYLDNLPNTVGSSYTLFENDTYAPGQTDAITVTAFFVAPDYSTKPFDWTVDNPWNQYQGMDTNFQVRFVTATVPAPPGPGPNPLPPVPEPPTVTDTLGGGIIPTGNPGNTTNTDITETQVPLAAPPTEATTETPTIQPTTEPTTQPMASSSEEYITDATGVPLAGMTEASSTSGQPDAASSARTQEETMKKNPKTGEADPAGFVIPGMGFVLAGSCVLVLTNRKKKENKE
ncbi:MAG: LPXTG cell wall anchor domain-containing protein [Oscillospiraceae bacterium]|nr:LPXTG cell wall anchor domain-containing protein [Oscillospiraceae bacterium]